MHVHEVSVKDITCSNLTMSRAQCLFCLPRSFSRSYFLAAKGRDPLGALSYLFVFQSQALGLVHLERIPLTNPRMLRACHKACAKLETARQMGTRRGIPIRCRLHRESAS